MDKTKDGQYSKDEVERKDEVVSFRKPKFKIVEDNSKPVLTDPEDNSKPVLTDHFLRSHPFETEQVVLWLPPFDPKSKSYSGETDVS